ncbi:MAG: prepilin-type N-terminal cleavage/methylation domain-containing protein [Pseudohongiellaceae bacterium]|nr:prepilin-type N-terminal cleavage/methylation domain-containing protein [Pseudohongiellaceae bacterium]
MTPTFASRPLQSPAAGFTLLELIVVLAIIAMGSVIVIPNISGGSGASFNAQTRDAVNLLNYERRMAVVTGQPTEAVFIATEREQGSGSNGTASEGEERWYAQQLSLAHRDSTGRESPVEDRLIVSFFPEGGSTGGALIIRQDEREAVISVNPFSGRVTLEANDE